MRRKVQLLATVFVGVTTTVSLGGMSAAGATLRCQPLATTGQRLCVAHYVAPGPPDGPYGHREVYLRDHSGHTNGVFLYWYDQTHGSGGTVLAQSDTLRSTASVSQAVGRNEKGSWYITAVTLAPPGTGTVEIGQVGDNYFYDECYLYARRNGISVSPLLPTPCPAGLEIPQELRDLIEAIQ